MTADPGEDSPDRPCKSPELMEGLPVPPCHQLHRESRRKVHHPEPDFDRHIRRSGPPPKVPADIRGQARGAREDVQ